MDNKSLKSKPSLEERTTVFLERLRPYAVRLWVARWAFIKFNVIVAVLGSAYLLLFVKPSFESSVDILPEYGARSMMSNLSELAAVAGLSTGVTAPTEIYLHLVVSEAVLEPVIYAKYKTDAYKDSVNLVNYFEISVKDEDTRERTERKRYLKMYRMLTKTIVRTRLDRLTKLLSVTVEAPEAKLSSDIVNNVVESLDRYIRTKRKSYASNQRFYIEERLAQVKDSLNVAEEKLKSFRERNKVTGQSPQLMLDEQRLIRKSELLQSAYVELTRQLELVKIDEIRDTPVVDIQELARDPITQSNVGRKTKLAVLLLFSGAISALYFAKRDQIRKYGVLILQTIKSRA